MLLGNAVRLGLLVFLVVNFYAVSLRFLPVPTTILMVQRGLGGEEVRRAWTRLEDISPYMTQAVMGGEDSRFCEHDGIDWAAIEQAFEENQEGGRRRGGSTITQQTAKNVFFWNGGGYVRKAGEAWFASLIDFIWGKRRVMEVYLNVAEWGDGIFGVEAAAQARFGKSAKNLSQQEAALLAAVLPSPNKWRLDPPTDFVRGRARVLRQRMTVIRNSNYDVCVNGARVVRAQPKPAEPKQPEIEEPGLEKPKLEKPKLETPSVQKPTIETQTPSLEDVLDSAENSLEKETDMTEPKPKPPVSIPQPDPATIPKTPNEIAPDITPEAPRDIPQEIPVENPPAEIPQRIDTPRVPPEP